MDHKSTNGMGMNAGGRKGREEIISIFFVRQNGFQTLDMEL